MTMGSKMTQEEFAAQTGTQQSFISKLETGRSNASWQVAKIMASITRTQPDLWLPGWPEGNIHLRKQARENATEQLWRRKYGN